jgi:hypothetical protein
MVKRAWLQLCFSELHTVVEVAGGGIGLNNTPCLVRFRRLEESNPRSHSRAALQLVDHNRRATS